MNNETITIKTIVDENFQDYKYASMFLAMPKCDFKCFKELGRSIEECQNFSSLNSPNINVYIKDIFRRYTGNTITKSLIFGGLEPILSFNELLNCINYFRENGCLDDIVIYTGYYENEIEDKIFKLRKFPNIVMKFGRFIPGSKSKLDSILEVTLASDNQYAKKIS
ncbi:MAG: hypothetical protein LBK29_01070 [Oscillospiraceae bacterium]|nr:hypothetical protein [Oscillospiraceae bacterium]